MEQRNEKSKIAETIWGIKMAREELHTVAERFREKCRPKLTDHTLIPVLYDWFRELSEGSCKATVRQVYGFFPEAVSCGAMTVEQRRMFIFIVLYLYAPSRLFSGKMPRGLRRAIALTLGVASDTVLSDNANDVLKRYEIYRSWAKEVDKVLSVILDRLKLADGCACDKRRCSG